MTVPALESINTGKLERYRCQRLHFALPYSEPSRIKKRVRLLVLMISLVNETLLNGRCLPFRCVDALVMLSASNILLQVWWPFNRCGRAYLDIVGRGGSVALDLAVLVLPTQQLWHNTGRAY